jgi:hypothetical protein
MAIGEITGGTHQEIAEMKYKYEKSPKYINDDVPFKTAYCLTRVGKQPEDYDGPDRFCKNRVSRPDDGSHAPSCNFHGGVHGGGASDESLSNLDTLAPLKHGMYATEKHLEEDFTEQDQKLYDYVMSWAETYGWPSREEDPSRYDDLHAIAVAKVRNARANQYIFSEGELKRQEIYDENGNLIEKDNPHALSEDVRLKRKLITDLKKELGLTPKARSRMDTDEKEASAIEQLSEVASKAVLGGGENGEEPSFDPDDGVFEENG